MFSLVQVELYKIFKRPRTYIAFGAVAALIGIIQFGLKLDGKSYLDFMLNDLSSSLEIDGKILNGYLVCYVMLQLLLVHVPLLIALIAADMISGEANMGTLRLLLIKPYSRTTLLLAKFIAAIIYTLMLLVWLAILALFGSMLLFGTDDMFLLNQLCGFIKRVGCVLAVYWCLWLCGTRHDNRCGTWVFLICVCRKFDRSHCCNHERDCIFYHIKHA